MEAGTETTETTEREEQQEEEKQPEGKEQEEGEGKDNVGRVEEILGVVVEAVFPGELPEIIHALVL